MSFSEFFVVWLLRGFNEALFILLVVAVIIAPVAYPIIRRRMR